MRKAAVVFAFTAMLAVVPFADPARGGGGMQECCICSKCESGPGECRLLPVSCDITCQQAGCGEFGFAQGDACSGLPFCGGAAALPAPAPAAGTVGLAALGALLAASGVYRLSRRRA